MRSHKGAWRIITSPGKWLAAPMSISASTRARLRIAESHPWWRSAGGWQAFRDMQTRRESPSMSSAVQKSYLCFRLLQY